MLSLGISVLAHSVFMALLLSLAAPAMAMVGDTSPPTMPIKRQVVMIAGSSGSFCTATVIARDVLLTAAHCIHPRNRYRIIDFSPEGQPLQLEVASAKRHPSFDINAFHKNQATADVALLKLTQPLPEDYLSATLAPAKTEISVGTQLTIAGFGVSVDGDGGTGGILRTAQLTVVGRPGTLQVRLVDPAHKNMAPSAGACAGDSGAPAFDASGSVVGVVTWSTAPNNEVGCGGLTGITPLALYLSWVRASLPSK